MNQDLNRSSRSSKATKTRPSRPVLAERVELSNSVGTATRKSSAIVRPPASTSTNGSSTMRPKVASEPLRMLGAAGSLRAPEPPALPPRYRWR